MKKIFTILLVLCLLFTAACVPSAPAATPEPTIEATPAPTPAPTEAAQGELPPLSERIDAEEILQLRSDARWLFEQMFLPRIVFELSGEAIMDYIENSDVEAMRELLLAAWSYVTAAVAGQALGDRVSFMDEDNPREALGLGDEHIVDVTRELFDQHAAGFLIKMLDIEQFLRSTYIAIVYSETEGLRMFTLEQSEGFHMFCFVEVDSRGSFFAVENSREAFIEAIRSEL